MGLNQVLKHLPGKHTQASHAGTKASTKPVRLRAGLYEYKGHIIERKDKAAEVYPRDDYYNWWSIQSPGDYGSGTGTKWLMHFGSLVEAVNAVDSETNE